MRKRINGWGGRQGGIEERNEWNEGEKRGMNVGRAMNG
jgi:hypothetical protein